MPDDRTPIYLFEVDGAFYFSHFFDRTDLFEELADYYDDDTYRFEVPADAIDEVSGFLRDHRFEPVIVDDVEAFCVVKERYTAHAEILKRSVLNWQRREFNFFVMRDPLAVERAVEAGATRLEDTDLVLGI